MQRRVALARAFGVKPLLLLMDEPFASLDEPLAWRLRGGLHALWSHHRPTVLFVTHDLTEALSLADRVLFLSPRPGRVVWEQPVDLPRPRERDDSGVERLRADLLARHPELLAGARRRNRKRWRRGVRCRDRRNAAPMNGSATTTPALEVQGLGKSYGPLKALDDVSLAVAAGEFVGLLGPNGAGKTTLFQILSGLFVADGGSVHVLGHDIRHSATAALAGIGVVFQQPTLDLDLSVLANLRFSARMHGMPRVRRRERIEAELERLGLDEVANAPARTLSGGNRRRVELARALVHEPSVLLMDEATVGLDPASRRQLLDYVLELRRERSVGVLWSTHLVDEVERADRVVILHRGRVLDVGSPEAIVARAGAESIGEAFLAMTGSGKAPDHGSRG